MDPDVFMTMGQEGWRQNKIVGAVWRIGSKGRQNCRLQNQELEVAIIGFRK